MATNCDEPVCKSKSDAMRKMFGHAAGKGGGGSGGSGGGGGHGRSSTTPRPAAVDGGGTSAAAAPCPPDRDELGRHSWTLLHTLAAYFPNSPSAAQSDAARSFVRTIGDLYPCRHCAEDFRAHLEESPPRVGSRAELSVWMCEAHNRVNRLLGKVEFSCTLSDLDRRWRKGGAHCDGEEESSLGHEVAAPAGAAPAAS